MLHAKTRETPKIDRLLAILRAFPRAEPTKKKFVDDVVAWSSTASEHPQGDPQLHHVAGSIFAQGRLFSPRCFRSLLIGFI